MIFNIWKVFYIGFGLWWEFNKWSLLILIECMENLKWN